MDGQHMGAAALAARLIPSQAVARAGARPRARGLGFDEVGGPLVAVCGLTGGAGTTTLALELARHAASGSWSPVLLAEADPGRAGLTVLTGRSTPYALAELAQQLADDTPPEEPFVELAPRLRLIAAPPRQCATAHVEAVRELLRDARAAHGLVVIDCGTSWSAGDSIVCAATHTLWTMPATPAGLAQAQAVLDSPAVPAAGRSLEVLVAIVSNAAGPAVRVRALRRLAQRRCERLILIPHSHGVARGEPDPDAFGRAVRGLAPTLRRRP